MHEFWGVKRSNEVTVDDRLHEMATHGSYALPMAVYLDEFDQYSSPIIQRHWHKELQFTMVLRGNVYYGVNDETITLVQNEGIFINSNVLHMARPFSAEGSLMFSVLFAPSIIGGPENSILHKQYIAPICSGNQLQHIGLHPHIHWHNQILGHLQQILSAEAGQGFGYDLEIANHLGAIWLVLIRNMQESIKGVIKPQNMDEVRIKRMLDYIHVRCSEKVVLRQIAAAANVSVSECCRCFQRVLQMTPFAYLIRYRISTAMEKLVNTSLSIAEISDVAGFHNTSYFHKVFRQITGSTPTEIRERKVKAVNPDERLNRGDELAAESNTKLRSNVYLSAKRRSE